MCLHAERHESNGDSESLVFFETNRCFLTEERREDLSQNIRLSTNCLGGREWRIRHIRDRQWIRFGLFFRNNPFFLAFFRLFEFLLDYRDCEVSTCFRSEFIGHLDLFIRNLIKLGCDHP